MSLNIFNTLSGKKEDFLPLMGRALGINVSGVTLYDSVPHHTMRRKANFTRGLFPEELNGK
jgi:cysteinyl-tRNA synthetase